jgi:hypothetical protein
MLDGVAVFSSSTTVGLVNAYFLELRYLPRRLPFAFAFALAAPALLMPKL